MPTYQITSLSEAQARALRVILKELEGKGDLAQQYIQVLIAQELKDNSKWIISDGQTMPIIDLGETSVPTPAP